MSYLTKIILILAIGILSFTFGENGSASDNSSPRNEARDIVTGLANYTYVSYKRMCDAANLSAVSQAIHNDYERLVNCHTDTVNNTVLSRIREMIRTDYDDKRLLPKLFCDTYPPYSKCLFDFENTVVKPCFPKLRWSMIEFEQNVKTAALDFICRDNHAISDRFVANDGISCIKSRFDGFLTCEQTMARKYYVPIYFDSISLEQQLIEYICRAAPGMQTCVIQEIRKCSNQTLVDIINDLINEVKEVLPCTNRVEAISTNLQQKFGSAILS